jgi:hypothetical protein
VQHHQCQQHGHQQQFVGSDQHQQLDERTQPERISFKRKYINNSDNDCCDIWVGG